MPIAPAQVLSRINTQTNAGKTHCIAKCEHQTQSLAKALCKILLIHLHLGLPLSLALKQNMTLLASSNIQACFNESAYHLHAYHYSKLSPCQRLLPCKFAFIVMQTGRYGTGPAITIQMTAVRRRNWTS